MISFIVRRLGLAIITVLGVLTIVFALQRLSGDPTNLLLPVDASPELRQEFRHQLGLDQPLPIQYVRFLEELTQGNLGRSFVHKQPALDIVFDRLPYTLVLAAVSLLMAIVLSLPLGILAAVYRDSWFDTLATGFSLIGQATPVYWLGLLFILLFSVELQWFPSRGAGSWVSLILPATTLAVFSMARITRITRSAVLEVLKADYVNTARSKGVREGVVLTKHVLRNAAIPIVTMIGLQFGGLLSGTVLTETVFSRPGIGRLIVDSVYNRDFPVVQAVTFVVAVGFSLINLIVDLAYAALNPKIRLD
mgnify:CR=1 FL=1